MEWISLCISGAGTPVLALCKVSGFAAQGKGKGELHEGRFWHLQARAGA